MAGNVGSGKTTASGLIAKQMGGVIADTREYDQTYLSDQFSDPKRWSFETQMALLGAKAVGIRNAVEVGRAVVVDRSLQEDVQIFARYFLEQGFLDQRAFQTYVEYAELLSGSLPPWDAVVYCRCPAQDCLARISKRPRPYQELYPSDFVERLGALYEDWWATSSAPLQIVVNTLEFDLRVASVAREFSNFVGDALAALSARSDNQLSLFEDPADAVDLPNNPIAFAGEVRRSRARAVTPPIDAPQAYLAAPFTAVATASPLAGDAGDRLLLDVDGSHGAIPEDDYRDALLKAAGALEARGFRTLLPHRDINRWGERVMRPGEVARECLEAVRKSSVVVALLSTSFGAHVESAAALAWGIPVVLVRTRAGEESFFASALRSSGLCASISIGSLGDLADMIRSDEFDLALSGAVRARRRLNLRSWAGE